MVIVWDSGTFCDEEQLCISAQEPALLMGAGIFETMVWSEGRIRFVEVHWERLMKGCHALSLSLPVTKEQVEQVVLSLINLNRLSTPYVRVRLTLLRRESRGSAPSTPRILLTIQEAPTPHLDQATAVVSSMVRNERSPLTSIKSTSYLENLLAQEEAEQAGATDALLLNTRGRVAECARANLFVVRGGVLWTPPIEDGALPGVMRHVVLDGAKRLGIAVKIESVFLEQLMESDEVFLTSAVRGVRPLVWVDSHTLPFPVEKSVCALLTKKIQRSAIASESAGCASKLSGR